MQNRFCVDAAAGRQPDWEEARKMEESEWSLEPEGEAEVPEIIVVLDAVEGTFVDLDGEKPSGGAAGKPPENVERSKGVDRTEMRKEEKRLRCALLNGSVWSIEKKCTRRYKGKCDVFFGIEHRLRKQEVEGAVKQRGQGRMDICGECGKNH